MKEKKKKNNSFYVYEGVDRCKLKALSKVCRFQVNPHQDTHQYGI